MPKFKVFLPIFLLALTSCQPDAQQPVAPITKKPCDLPPQRIKKGIATKVSEDDVFSMFPNTQLNIYNFTLKSATRHWVDKSGTPWSEDTYDDIRFYLNYDKMELLVYLNGQLLKRHPKIRMIRDLIDILNYETCSYYTSDSKIYHLESNGAEILTVSVSVSGSTISYMSGGRYSYSGKMPQTRVQEFVR